VAYYSYLIVASVKGMQGFQAVRGLCKGARSAGARLCATGARVVERGAKNARDECVQGCKGARSAGNDMGCKDCKECEGCALRVQGWLQGVQVVHEMMMNACKVARSARERDAKVC
jgi:hypothetical protein